MVTWRNRIVGHGEESPEHLLANPLNFRIHPRTQAEALARILGDVGWVDSIIVNRRTGHVIDGHLRVKEALSAGAQTVPVTYVDLDEDEEKRILAVFDYVTTLAGVDESVLGELLASIGDTGDIGDILSEVAEVAGIELPDGDEWGEAFAALPDGAPTHTQMAFTLTEEQAETVRRALALAVDMGPFVDTGNENRNGNALARVCETFLGMVEDG